MAPRSSLVRDLICSDAASRRLAWENDLLMQNSLLKLGEANRRAREKFYQLAWLDQEEEQEEEDCKEEKQHTEELTIRDGSTKYERQPWKIQHFSEFKNDEIKRDEIKKMLKSKKVCVAEKKLVLKKSPLKPRQDDNNNNLQPDLQLESQTDRKDPCLGVLDLALDKLVKARSGLAAKQKKSSECTKLL